MSFLRLAVRRAMKRPWFSLVVIALLAVGIGMNVTAFAVVNSVAFRDLPFPNADRIVAVNLAPTSCAYCMRQSVPRDAYDRWTQSVRSATQWSARHGISNGMVFSDSHREVHGEAVTPSFLSMFGVRVALGRTFIDADDVPGGPQRVLLSHQLWRTRYAADPAMVGRFISLNDKPFEVVGVLDPAAVWPGSDAPPEIVLTPSAFVEPNTARVPVFAFARLRDGTTSERLRNELMQAAGSALPNANAQQSDLGPSVISLRVQLAIRSSIEMLTLQGLALIVLAAACLNVGGLLIARVESERHLIGMRVILGARVRDLIRVPLADVLPLVVVGSVLGLILGARAIPFVGAYLGSVVPVWANIGVDARVVGVAVMMALLCAAVIAAIPARAILRTELRSWLQASAPSLAGTRDVRARQRTLVSVQLGVSTTLLVMGALLAQNYVRLSARDRNAAANGSMYSSFAITNTANVRATMDAVLQRVGGVSGVTGAAFSQSLRGSTRATTELAVVTDRPDGNAPSGLRSVSGAESGPRIGTGATRRVVAGRDFTDDEIRVASRDVIVVDERFAETLWPNERAVGHHVRLTGRDEPQWRTVVGVTEGLTRRGYYTANAVGPTVPWFAIPGVTDDAAGMGIAIATQGEADPHVDAVAAAIEDVAPGALGVLLPSGANAAARAASRVRTLLLILLAALAVALSTAGVGALVAYSAGLRRREFGLRAALGATPLDVARNVIADALKTSAQGMVLGVVGTAFAVMLLIPMVYFGVRLFDWRVLAGALVLMNVLTVCASLVPAIRAARTDPADVLRSE